MFNFSLILLLLAAAARSFAYVSGDGPEVSSEGGVNGKQKYIVYMGARHPHITPDMLVSAHKNLLSSVMGSKAEAHASVVHTYKRSFSGFSAWLTESQAESISIQPGVVNVFPSHIYQLQTTRSWDFVGLHNTTLGSESSFNHKGNSLLKPRGQGDVIIGVLDTGIWPELESFSDDGFEAIPKRWKGVCQNKKPDEPFKCNKKLIGARAYGDAASARDDEGHGTHTTSTAGGNAIEGASLFGLGNGTAKGGLPSARVAMYKVCFSLGCTGEAILAAFDDAIADGVDVMSLSLGGPPIPYDQDVIAIGSFHAVAKGIVVSCAAGNSGPVPSSLSNGAPWILTVGASTLDRNFFINIKLGNGQTVRGRAFNLEKEGKPAKLVLGANAAAGNGTEAARFCAATALDVSKVKGSIMVCEFSPTLRAAASRGLHKLGAAGYITGNDVFSELLAYLALPGAIVDLKTFKEISDYSNTSDATATISPTQTEMGVAAPVVAGFSSRGPHVLGKDVLKPDVIAPGVNILASWPTTVPLFFKGDNSTYPVYSGNFSIISGTSMACPHATGAAAFVKLAHPRWSPAAIKSALVTTAIPTDNKGKVILDYDATVASPFEAGAGEISPKSAINPGLVYDATDEEYLTYLCQSGYSSSKLQVISGFVNFTCAAVLPDLNYPSISVPKMGNAWTVKRTVTNVGPASSTYKVKVSAPNGVQVTVTPDTLMFTQVGQKLSYTVSFKAAGLRTTDDWSFGYISWSSGSLIVRSPIAVKA